MKNENIETRIAFDDLKLSYIESSLDRLNTMESLVTRFIDDSAGKNSDITELSGHIHSLKGSAGVYGFMSVTVIAHQLEDYLAAANPLNADILENVKIYLDQISKILENRTNPSEPELQELLRGLPVAQSGNSEFNLASSTRVLLIMEKGVLRDMASLPIIDAGFNLSMVDNTLDAFELIVTRQPDFVVSSMEFPFLSGAELARATFAMRATANIPFVLLTSHSLDVISSEELPSEIHVIRKEDGHIGELVSYLLGTCRSCQGTN